MELFHGENKILIFLFRCALTSYKFTLTPSLFEIGRWARSVLGDLHDGSHGCRVRIDASYKTSSAYTRGPREMERVHCMSLFSFLFHFLFFPLLDVELEE